MEIDVLGLGGSLKEFKPSKNITIGVNDIWEHHEVDNLVVIDRPTRFKKLDPLKERLEIILKSTPKKFYTHIDDWQGLVPNVQMIVLEGPSGSIQKIESQTICFSNNSVYVAVVIAYKMGARKINVFGADFNNHPRFKGGQIDRTVNDFRQLFSYLKSRGVKIWVTKESKLIEAV